MVANEQGGARRQLTANAPVGFDAFEQFFDAIPSPYMMLDTELRYVAANQAYLEATNSTPELLLGQNIFDVFPNDGAAGRDLKSSFMRVIESGKSDTLSYIHYAIPDATGETFEDRYWTAVHFPIFNEDGYVAYVVQNTVDVTELHNLRNSSVLPFRYAKIETDLIQRAQEAEEAHRALLAENNDFRRLFNQAPGMIAVLSGPEHVFTFTNEAYTRFIGGRRVVGETVRDALPEIDGQGFFEMLDGVYTSGNPVSINGARIVIQYTPNGPAEEAFLDFSYHPIFDHDGAVNGIFVQGMDRTESMKADQSRELLLRELNHRVKNLFSVAMSMVNMTARNATSPSEMAQILTGRLSALSHAHGMVMNEGGLEPDAGRIAFSELLRKVMAPHVGDGSRLEADGPPLMLGSKAATSLALVIHELATNAVKYGAFTAPGGSVSVHWTITAGEVAIRWREAGGPPIEGTPLPSGFGSRLARISVEGQLGGRLSFNWPKEGAQVDLAFPLDNAAI
ncbi:sensor histidine kinase [Pararhizobium haloflavum]|uniref:sensor histidine kinase n=1 Tax=Pararhizobium haloflavum TaxID=2037914 RepID=UPI000C1A077C|nr:PAS domain-containing protein [Pararhizobium haloflavum]